MDLGGEPLLYDKFSTNGLVTLAFPILFLDGKEEPLKKAVIREREVSQIATKIFS